MSPPTKEHHVPKSSPFEKTKIINWEYKKILNKEFLVMAPIHLCKFLKSC